MNATATLKRPLTSVALVLFGALPALAACGGQVIPLGTQSSQLRSVDPSEVGGACAACPSGYAHPNVCCETNADAPATCGAYIQHPFQACEAGWTTYPNPLSCCELSNDQHCIDTPTDDAGSSTGSTPPSYGCGYACPPGWYSPPGESPTAGSGSCCQVNSNGSTACYGWASAAPTPIYNGNTNSSGSSSSGPICVGVSGGSSSNGNTGVATPIAYADASSTYDAGAYEDGGIYAEDAGTYADDGGIYSDDGGYYCDEDAGTVSVPPGYDGGVYSLCEACPPGWFSPSEAPELCCQNAPNGISQCFSNATGPIGVSVAEDAGVGDEVPDAGVISVPPAEGEDAGVSSVPSGGSSASPSAAPAWLRWLRGR